MRNIIPLWPLFMLLFGCEESPSEELADGSGGSPKMVGGTEICDGIDNDGDGLVDDEDPSLDGSTATTWFPDRDRDGFGAGTPFRGCDRPLPIHVRNGRDCDDRDSRVHPGGLEVCNGTDDDCDGLIDDDDPGLSTFNTHAYFLDEDGDGYGLTTEGVSACESPSGYAVEYGDCDDSDSAVSPGAIEVCNTIDDDCDGDTDDEDGDMDTATTTAWYIDYDGDGYGVETYTWLTCESPSGTVDNADDCDDVEEGINPEATEVCNDADDDCDGDTDEGVGSPSVWYLDHDGDGYGTSKFSTNECTAPSGYVDNDEDCDDLEATTNPGETEVDGDGVDNDCVNDPPSLTGVTLSADEVTTDETLVLTVTSSDPDGDDVTLKMSWTVDGIEVLTDAEELDGSVYFDRDQEVSVTVTPTDGTDAGTSETVTALVLNTPPTPPVVSVTPDEPEEG